MPDDFTAPLGLDWDRGPRRYRRIWPVPIAMAIVLALLVTVWTALVPSSSAGGPVVRLDIPKTFAANPPAVPAPPSGDPAAPAAPAAAIVRDAPPAPDDNADSNSGQIIIRDP